ncbi:hypothetical protein CAC42_6816 [Sphaceloma murrayae]|uniref:Uncharacterized protein n=1 Tax=Sphaceloma murrayae TaxID=2082308 RepID=A0A2K1QHG8_9PEZI|nr:hypothetical protein CAC42_6816 [Sphaceloma murrayae]
MAQSKESQSSITRFLPLTFLILAPLAAASPTPVLPAVEEGPAVSYGSSSYGYAPPPMPAAAPVPTTRPEDKIYGNSPPAPLPSNAPRPSTGSDPSEASYSSNRQDRQPQSTNEQTHTTSSNIKPMDAASTASGSPGDKKDTISVKPSVQSPSGITTDSVKHPNGTEGQVTENGSRPMRQKATLDKATNETLATDSSSSKLESKKKLPSTESNATSIAADSDTRGSQHNGTTNSLPLDSKSKKLGQKEKLDDTNLTSIIKDAQHNTTKLTDQRYHPEDTLNTTARPDKELKTAKHANSTLTKALDSANKTTHDLANNVTSSTAKLSKHLKDAANKTDSMVSSNRTIAKLSHSNGPANLTLHNDRQNSTLELKNKSKMNGTAAIKDKSKSSAVFGNGTISHAFANGTSSSRNGTRLSVDKGRYANGTEKVSISDARNGTHKVSLSGGRNGTDKVSLSAARNGTHDFTLAAGKNGTHRVALSGGGKNGTEIRLSGGRNGTISRAGEKGRNSTAKLSEGKWNRTSTSTSGPGSDEYRIGKGGIVDKDGKGLNEKIQEQVNEGLGQGKDGKGKSLGEKISQQVQNEVYGKTSSKGPEPGVGGGGGGGEDEDDRNAFALSTSTDEKAKSAGTASVGAEPGKGEQQSSGGSAGGSLGAASSSAAESQGGNDSDGTTGAKDSGTQIGQSSDGGEGAEVKSGSDGGGPGGESQSGEPSKDSGRGRHRKGPKDQDKRKRLMRLLRWLFQRWMKEQEAKGKNSEAMDLPEDAMAMDTGSFGGAGPDKTVQPAAAATADTGISGPSHAGAGFARPSALR